MAQSRDESRNDQKLVSLLESLAQKQERQPSPIACRLCDEIFFDNRALLNHFQSHFLPNGAFNPSSLVRNIKLSENEMRLYSTPVQNAHSFSVGNHVANHNIRIPATLSFRNPVVSGSSQIPVQPRVPTFAHRYHPYQLSSIPRSSVGIGPSGSGSNGLPRFFYPVGRHMPDISSSKLMEGSSTHFSMKTNSSASLDLSLSLEVGCFASPIPSTSLGKCPLTAVGIEPEDPFQHYTKPYIMLLDKPIEKMADIFGAGGGKMPDDDLDLTLKL